MTLTNVKETPMCSPATCSQCGKTTWTGCGNHIDQALAGVPKNQQCTCQEAAPSSESLLSRIFSR